jgi:hypothetical protein
LQNMESIFLKEKEEYFVMILSISTMLHIKVL